MPFLYLHISPEGGVEVLKKAWNLLSNDAKAILRTAESNLDALNTVDLGPTSAFSVGKCALWARFAGPRFAAKATAAISSVKVPSSCCKAAAEAKEVWQSGIST